MKSSRGLTLAHHFSPLMTHPSDVASAVVWIPRTSDPAPGSVIA